MYRVDYHLHTHHSMDSKMSMDSLCLAAKKAGLNEICVTDHTEFGHPDFQSDCPPIMENLLADVLAARDKHKDLKIRIGLEIGDNPKCRDRIRAWHAAQSLDFRLLSLHLIDGADPYFPDFFANRSQDIFYRRYAESKLESVLAWPAEEYDAIAHLGYCSKFAPYPLAERPLRFRHAPDAFRELFLALARAGKALEINTSGYEKMGEFIPDRELITYFREFGGEFVTVGSDAHDPARVGGNLDLARKMAKSCGFQYLLAFENGKGIPVPL